VPTYQYACTECGHGFETVQSFTDDSLTVCPQCGARLRKVFNSVGIVFKGSGFYRTDSREKPSDAKASETKGDSKGSDSTAAKDGKGDKAGAKTTKPEPASSTNGSGSSGSSGSSGGSSSGSSSSGSSTAGSAA